MQATTESSRMRELGDRVVWITGASRGLGRALAHAAAEAGADLVLSARSEEDLRRVEADLPPGTGVEVVPGSVTDGAVVAETVARIERRWGRLDALVNNAGISPHFKRAEQLGTGELREVLETNLLGPFGCCLAALPLLEAAAPSSVVNVSSIHGERAHERMLPYGVSKGGLEMLTRTLAVEWAERGVRVNSLAPGYLETEMTAGLREHPSWSRRLLDRIPLGRFATAEEVAACALFLCCPASSYMTGSTLSPDGGWKAL